MDLNRDKLIEELSMIGFNKEDLESMKTECLEKMHNEQLKKLI